MSAPKPRVRYKTLTLAEKAAAIQEVEKGVKKKSQIAKEFKIPPTTLSTYLKNKEEILYGMTKENATVRKRSRGPENPDVDECVLKWYKQMRDEKPVSGTLVRTKAEEFAFKLGINNFKASSGWLDGFKDRNGISFKNVRGKNGEVDERSAESWETDLLQIIEGTLPENIFSVDETGLFFSCVPDKLPAFKDEHCRGGKFSKERITLLIGANMDGTEKLPLLMIGKSANPRCFRNLISKPVEYKANKKAWMTSNIFESWLTELDGTFRKKNRTILLFVDKCTAHTSFPPNMKNVKVVLFPPNAVQPMTQGVIKSFKHFYRRLLLQNVMSGTLLDKNGRVKIDLLEAVRMCYGAWEKVTAETVVRSFRKAGFAGGDKKEEAKEEVVLPGDNTVLENADPSEEFLNFDEDVEVYGILTDAEILAEVKVKEENSSSDEDVELSEAPIPTGPEALNHLKELRKFFEGQTGATYSHFQALDKLQEFVVLRVIDSKRQLQRLNLFQ